MVMDVKRGSGGVRTPSMVAVMRGSGTPVSLACISMRVTPQEEIPARNASLLVSASVWGRVDESNITETPRALLRARPMVPLLDDWTLSTFSSLNGSGSWRAGSYPRGPDRQSLFWRGRMRGNKETHREARRGDADARPQADSRLRAQGGGARVRLPVVGGDPARSIPAARRRGDVHLDDQARHLDRGGVP